MVNVYYMGAKPFTHRVGRTDRVIMFNADNGFCHDVEWDEAYDIIRDPSFGKDCRIEGDPKAIIQQFTPPGISTLDAPTVVHEKIAIEKNGELVGELDENALIDDLAKSELNKGDADQLADIMNKVQGGQDTPEDNNNTIIAEVVTEVQASDDLL